MNVQSVPPVATAPTVRVEAKVVLQRPRVLLVDDEPNVIDAIQANLRKEFEFTKCTRPLDALKLFGPQEFDAVVSDLSMPEMDGIRFLEEVKKVAPNVARILLTGHADVRSAIAAVNNASVHRFLVKPCPSAELAKTLRDGVASAKPVSAEALARLGRQATLGTIAGSIGHEIGNLVSALGGAIESMRETLERGEVPTVDDIGMIDLVKLRLVEHAKHLRDMSKPRSLLIEDLDATSVAAVGIHLLSKGGVLRASPAVLRAPPHSVMVRADRGSLEGVLLNLLKNAAEAIAQRVSREAAEGNLGERGAIDVTVIEAEGRRVRFMIEDNGVGIAPAELERLFETFRSSKGATGTGLGLSVAYQLVERMGGKLWAESTVGQGTRFTIDLPAA